VGAPNLRLAPSRERREGEEHHAAEASLAERARQRAAKERALVGGHPREEALDLLEGTFAPAA
jgi:hypothetical protein